MHLTIRTSLSSDFDRGRLVGDLIVGVVITPENGITHELSVQRRLETIYHRRSDPAWKATAISHEHAALDDLKAVFVIYGGDVDAFDAATQSAYLVDRMILPFTDEEVEVAA